MDKMRKEKTDWMASLFTAIQEIKRWTIPQVRYDLCAIEKSKKQSLAYYAMFKTKALTPEVYNGEFKLCIFKKGEQKVVS